MQIHREKQKKKTHYIDFKFLRSPIAGDISPPRFRLDRFLHKVQNKKLQREKFFNHTIIIELKQSSYSETTEKVTMSQ